MSASHVPNSAAILFMTYFSFVARGSRPPGDPSATPAVTSAVPTAAFIPDFKSIHSLHVRAVHRSATGVSCSLKALCSAVLRHSATLSFLAMAHLQSSHNISGGTTACAWACTIEISSLKLHGKCVPCRNTAICQAGLSRDISRVLVMDV